MRKVSLIAALIAAVAALLPSGGVRATAPTPTYEEGITFRQPVRMDYTDPAQVGGPGEPSIKVGPEGTVYTAGVCCVARGAPAWHSKDDGQTFSYLPSPGGVRENGLGAEGDFIVDDAGGVYFADTYIPSIYFTRWSDGGDVWEYTEDTLMVVPGLDDRPWLAYQHGLVHMYVNHGTHVTMYRSGDGGHTWDITYNSLGQGQRYWPGFPVADRDTDDVYLYGRCVGQTLCVAKSADQGGTWTEVQIGNPPRGSIAPIFVSAALDRAGNLYGAFADVNGSGCDVYLDVSTDKGETFQRYKVSPETGCSTFPWIAGGDDGRVALTWYHTDESRHQDQVPAAGEWRVQAAVVTGATSDEPVVTWGELPRIIHKGALGRTLWDYQQIDVGPDGRFHIAFAENHEAACAGNLSTHGGLAAYRNMCTTYVAQEGGPRAIAHAADETSIGALEVAATGDGLEVTGGATFGRATPVQILTDAGGDAIPGLDVTRATLVRESAGSDELVIALQVAGLPEVVGGLGEYKVYVGPNEDGADVNMTPRPWSFEVCDGTCTRIRGDANAGGDTIVARVPLERLGFEGGDTILTRGAAAFPAAGSACPSPNCDLAYVDSSYTVPGAEVTLTVTDADGAEVASVPAELSGDLSSFSAALDGLAPGEYTVVVEACFADNCASESRAVTVT